MSQPPQKSGDCTGAFAGNFGAENRGTKAKQGRERAGGSRAGRISWLRDEGRSAQLDFRNPDRSLRTRTLLGLPILVGFRDETRRAESGKIYDPATGWKVSGKLSLDETGDKLQVKGWVGLGPLRVSRSYVWSRNANAANAEGL